MNYLTCRYFSGEKPCRFHKFNRQHCRECPEFAVADFYIAVIKLDALGDVLRTTAVLEPLKELYPESYIVWIARREARDIFIDNHLVDEVICVEDPECWALQARHFDLVVNFDNTRLSASILSLLSSDTKKGFEINASGRVNPVGTSAGKWLHMAADDDMKRANRETYQRIMCDLFDYSGKPGNIILNLTEEEIFLRNCFLQEKNIDHHLCVGISLGGSSRWATKKWPEHHYDTLIRALTAEGIPVMLYGGPEEEELYNRIFANHKTIIGTGCRNDLRDYFALIDACTVMITPDTLSLHAALALGKYVVALVGPTSASELELYDQGVLVSSASECVCCYNSYCEEPVSCMEQIEPETVFEYAISLLQNQQMK